MLRKMMRSSRKHFGGQFEPWLERHKRSLYAAREDATRAGVYVEQVVADKRLSWAGHIARQGTKIGHPHVLKLSLIWRTLGWRRHQQVFNQMSYETLFHPFGWGHPRRWEDSLPTDWWTELSKES